MLNLGLTPMKIALAADHAGFLLKEELRDRLRSLGHQVEDLGPDSTASTDYPDYAAAVANKVAAGNVERGVLVCSTGMGMCMAANKVNGIRAAVAINEEAVTLTRQHNNANILTIGAKFFSGDAAAHLINVFLKTDFEGGRHGRRVDKISAMEHMAAQEPVSNS